MSVFIIYYLTLALIVFISLCSSENIFFSLNTFFMEWTLQNCGFHTQNKTLSPHGCAELGKQSIHVSLIKRKLSSSPKTASTLQVYF